MPWNDLTAPHFVLEVNQKCNISCRGCYKLMDGGSKPLSRLEAELETALTLRKIHTVSLAGGEPLLHPDILQIVRLVKSKKLRCGLITNGLLADVALLRSLKEAGLDMAMFHVDEGQTRPDLPDSSEEAVCGLRSTLAEKAASAGLEAGFSITIYPEYLERIGRFFERLINSPRVNFALVSNYMEPDSLAGKAEANGRIMKILKERLGVEPFSYIPSPSDRERPPQSPRWMSYFIPVIYSGGEPVFFPFRSTRFDSFLIALSRLFAGRYLFYFNPGSAAMLFQTLCNAAITGRLGEGAAFARNFVKKNSFLRAKRILVESGASVSADGTPECCDFCPNATLRDGKLTRICLADYRRK